MSAHLSPVNWLTQSKAHLPERVPSRVGADIWDLIWQATAVWLWVVIIWRVVG